MSVSLNAIVLATLIYIGIFISTFDSKYLLVEINSIGSQGESFSSNGYLQRKFPQELRNKTGEYGSNYNIKIDFGTI